eukprot:UN20015
MIDPGRIKNESIRTRIRVRNISPVKGWHINDNLQPSAHLILDFCIATHEDLNCLRRLNCIDFEILHKIKETNYYIKRGNDHLLRDCLKELYR